MTLSDGTLLRSLYSHMVFLSTFVQKIMICITSTRFSIKFNGDTYDFFGRKEDSDKGTQCPTLISVLVREYPKRALKIAMI